MIKLAANSTDRLVLGLDLGVASIGWSLIDLRKKRNKIVAMGVRRFEAGVDGDSSAIERGKAVSRNTKRREKRQVRRQGNRRGRRLAKLFFLLQKYDLLPAGESRTPEQRHALLQKFDAELAKKYASGESPACNPHVVVYHLRRLALDTKTALPPHELGRALYQLAQRRGFQTNLKASQGDEDEGVVKQGISQLNSDMIAAGAETVGAYFATLDPEEIRIRGKWTGRSMFLDEFKRIWAAQAPLHPHLTEDAGKEIHHAIFFQRPLKSQKHLIGHCELETSKRRAPIGCLEFQEFRMIQKVNDLTYMAPDGQILKPTSEQRQRLLDLLEREGDRTFNQVRTALGLKRPKGDKDSYTFNFEEGGAKHLPGNRTAAKLRGILEAKWDKLSTERQRELVDSILGFQSAPALRRHLTGKWNFSADQAGRITDARFEDGFGGLSRKAIDRVLPEMRTGKPYKTVEKELYPDARKNEIQVDELPPVFSAFPSLRNPSVARVLTELRKVINALIREYGIPDLVRVELARELKKNNKQREQIFKRIQDNQRARERAAKRILDELGEKYNTERNNLKVRLADECDWHCPYTGKGIEMATLIGDNPQFDIEHIHPFSLSLDNSFANKTLCYHEENRNHKKNLTPFLAYSSDESRWDEIVTRVKNFRGAARNRKLELFTAPALETDFSNRMLTDTQYVSRLAAEYVGLLFGGVIDAAKKTRVETRTGPLTSFLRREWNLNRILGPSDEKNRADHRHHAIDALAVACSSNAMVQALAKAASSAEESGLRRQFAEIPLPWETFLEETREQVNAIVVSTRVNRKVNGQIHDETIYSPPFPLAGGKDAHYRVRKPLERLSTSEVEKIIDPYIRAAVQEHIAKFGGDQKKAFEDRNNHPYVQGRNGRLIPIHKVRIQGRLKKPLKLGNGDAARYVAPGNNHHVEFFQRFDPKQESPVWDYRIVNLYEAMSRISPPKGQQRTPVIQRDHGPNTLFAFSLIQGEHVDVEFKSGVRTVIRCLKFSKDDFEFILLSDARTDKERKSANARIRITSLKKFQELNPRKVLVDPIGRVFPAND